MSNPAGRHSNIQRTIFINQVEIKDFQDLIDKSFNSPSLKHTQIVKEWHESKLNHNFKNEAKFKKAVERNIETLNSSNLPLLFTENNFLFNTQTTDREETLYFKKDDLTGRLRQQHRSGPLAQIDKQPKQHRFVTEKRFKALKKWHKNNKKDIPKFDSSEETPTENMRHIEFGIKKTIQKPDRIRGWHPSGGTVRLGKQNLDSRIASALKNILGYKSN